jgi:hypothetical protein
MEIFPQATRQSASGVLVAHLPIFKNEVEVIYIAGNYGLFSKIPVMRVLCTFGWNVSKVE